MHSIKAAVLCGAFVLAFRPSAQAQFREAKLPDPAQGYDWKEAAREHGLKAQEIEQLARDKILVTNQAFKQVFTPYISSDMPLFITSDSLLNGYHVLYEESVLRLERANARKLGGILKFIWGNLATADKAFEGKPELVAAAKLRAQVMIATAMRLLGDDPAPLDANVAALVKEETARVEAATGQMKPKWLGPPDDGFMALDYTRYKPRGFYTKTPALERYFRAVSWLQSVPFRVSKDEELVAILMLGKCVSRGRVSDVGGQPVIDHTPDANLRAFLELFVEFIGQGDDWGLLKASNFVSVGIRMDHDQDGLARLRKNLLDSANGWGNGPQINDQIAFAPDDPAQATEVTFRILPAYRTPDAVCSQRTTDFRKFPLRPLPTGMEVCAALGSPFARTRLAGEEKGSVLAVIDRCKPFFAGRSLYCDYLRCLEPLLAKPEPEAPPFMSSEAWRIKSCQTALSGWAQLRHTWALQAKEDVMVMGITETFPGFAEPAPEFFSRMATLAEKTEAALKKAGALADDGSDLAADLRVAIKMLEKNPAAKTVGEALEGLTATERWELVFKSDFVPMEFDLPIEFASPTGEKKPAETPEALSKVLDRLRKLADDLEHGRTPAEPWMAEAIERRKFDLGELWRSLGTISRRLEALSHKQLRGVALSEDENRFIRSYGKKLAAVMLYRETSHEEPNDDAPRVVDVCFNPRTGQYLEVGIARPRAMYVLYPVKGGEILCRGAVMPYYEFANDARLTDAEWQTMLDSDKRPKSPGWLGAITVPGGLSAPKLEPPGGFGGFEAPKVPDK